MLKETILKLTFEVFYIQVKKIKLHSVHILAKEFSISKINLRSQLRNNKIWILNQVVVEFVTILQKFNLNEFLMFQEILIKNLVIYI